MALSEKIKNLKTLIGEHEGIGEKEFYSFSSFAGGIPKGCLIEVSGHSKAEWILQFLKENLDLQVMWFEEKQALFPTAVSQRGISVKRIVFTIAEKDLFSSLRKVLQSQIFPIVVSPSSFKELKLLKSLQLLSEKSNATVFLLAKEHKPAWPIAIQCGVYKERRNSDYSVELIKHKYIGHL